MSSEVECESSYQRNEPESLDKYYLERLFL